MPLERAFLALSFLVSPRATSKYGAKSTPCPQGTSAATEGGPANSAGVLQRPSQGRWETGELVAHLLILGEGTEGAVGWLACFLLKGPIQSPRKIETFLCPGKADSEAEWHGSRGLISGRTLAVVKGKNELVSMSISDLTSQELPRKRDKMWGGQQGRDGQGEAQQPPACLLLHTRALKATCRPAPWSQRSFSKQEWGLATPPIAPGSLPAAKPRQELPMGWPKSPFPRFPRLCFLFSNCLPGEGRGINKLTSHETGESLN